MNLTIKNSQKMKHMKFIFALVIVSSLLTFCNIKEVKKNSKKYTNAELIGKWKQLNSDTNPEIQSIELLKDGNAKIQLIDSIGARTINGTWENGFQKNTTSSHNFLQIESDILIRYFSDKNHINVLAFRVDEENKKILMDSGELKLEKE